ncbi:hypothetical protein ACPV3A_32730 [Paenibacillus sp. Dod16]|uniref:hypothetical protein n=1 Tax=Paenibacillus sp. Dod16 TaxID=3416392 RepID=UPI003CEE6CAB
MAKQFTHFLVKFCLFSLFFFFLYICAFVWSMDLVGSFIDTTNHTIRHLAYGTFSASFFSFITTATIHVITYLFFKKTDFSSWFRTINHLFLYLSGLGTAIISMKSFLINAKVVTGHELIFDDQFNLIGLVFFIAIFNYNLYNSLVLSKEILGFEQFKIQITKKAKNSIIAIKSSLKHFISRQFQKN